jgi:hypothetical protein
MKRFCKRISDVKFFLFRLIDKHIIIMSTEIIKRTEDIIRDNNKALKWIFMKSYKELLI